MLITGERHLRLVLDRHADHCNAHRPHRTLHQNSPAGRREPPAPGTSIRVLRRTGSATSTTNTSRLHKVAQFRRHTAAGQAQSRAILERHLAALS
jgi:hypothetical protein